MSEDLEQFKALYRQLDSLIRDLPPGAEEPGRADEIRDLMDGPWCRMTADERQAARDYSVQYEAAQKSATPTIDPATALAPYRYPGDGF